MYKIIFTHAPKYLTGSVITAGITLLMTKYYTAVFTPAMFGILALYLVMFKYITTLVSLNMDSGATRFYFDYRETKRDEYLSTIFWLISIIAIAVLTIGLICMPLISDWIAPNSQLIYAVTIITAIGAVYVSFLMRVLYNEHKSTSILKHTVFQTVINHISSVLFISVFHFSILGRISGQGLGYFFNILTLIREFTKKNLFHLEIKFDKAMAKETFLLSVPGAITALLSVLFVYVDRIFIKHYIGDSAVGIYTLGYMLGEGLSMVYEAIAQSLLPKIYSDMNKNYEKTRDELERFSYRYYLGLLILTVAISALSPIIVSIFANKSYQAASNVMPFVMIGFMMGGFYKIPSLVLGYQKKVWIYPFLAFFAFGVNALLNWWLIPIYGIIGAAFASFMGLFLYSTAIQIFSFKYMSKKYNVLIALLYISIFIIISSLFLSR